MSKITINAVLTVLRLVVAFLGKCVRLLYTVIDLVDDGCINASVSRPDWVITLASVIDTLESLQVHASNIEDDVYKSLSVPGNVKE